MDRGQEGSIAEDIKGFFSSLFGSSPAPQKKAAATPAKVSGSSHPSSSQNSSLPIVRKSPKSLEDDWTIVTNDKKRNLNIPSDLKRRTREGNWNYKEYIMSEDYSQSLPDGPSQANDKENLSRFQYVFMEYDKIDLEHLKRCMWDRGCHKSVRSSCWKVLLGYLPTWIFLHDAILSTRRSCYASTVKSTHRNVDHDEDTQTTKQLIRSGLSNTALKIPLFRSAKLAKMLERIIYIWLQDNVSQPYVDTLALIPLPITYAFLAEYGEVEKMDVDRDLSDEQVFNLEVDVYNCMSYLLTKTDAKQFLSGSHHVLIGKLAKKISQIDPNLAAHIEANVNYVDFALVWFDTLLIDQFQKMALTTFLWDRYLASNNFVEYHVTLCARLLVRFQNEIKKLKANDLLQFLQHLPLYNWDYSHVEQLIESVQESPYLGFAPPAYLDYPELKARAIRRSKLDLISTKRLSTPSMATKNSISSPSLQRGSQSNLSASTANPQSPSSLIASNNMGSSSTLGGSMLAGSSSSIGTSSLFKSGSSSNLETDSGVSSSSSSPKTLKS